VLTAWPDMDGAARHRARAASRATAVLRRTTLREAQRSPTFVPLQTENGLLMFAHRRAYPMLVGRDFEVDCRRRLGIRSFSGSLPPDLGLRASFGRGPARPATVVSSRARIVDAPLRRRADWS
jgi:hypothetical protein